MGNITVTVVYEDFTGQILINDLFNTIDIFQGLVSKTLGYAVNQNYQNLYNIGELDLFITTKDLGNTIAIGISLKNKKIFVINSNIKAEDNCIITEYSIKRRA
jgi:hypothetical protein